MTDTDVRADLSTRVGAGAVRMGKKRPGDVYKWGCLHRPWLVL